MTGESERVAVEWEFDEAAFSNAAQVVMALNNSLTKRFDGRRHGVISWLKIETQWACPQPGYWGTEGFNVSVMWKSGQEGRVLYCRADPAGYLVLGALIRASKKAEKEGVA